MLTRKRYREVPPRVDYELTERARSLAPILGELARWGYEWTWSAPASHRGHRPRSDLPSHPRPDAHRRHTDGNVELVVTDGRGEEPMSYVVSLAGRRRQPARGRQRQEPTHHCAAAPMPGSALSRRSVTATPCSATGDRGLADALLDVLDPRSRPRGRDRRAAAPPPRRRPSRRVDPGPARAGLGVLASAVSAGRALLAGVRRLVDVREAAGVVLAEQLRERRRLPAGLLALAELRRGAGRRLVAAGVGAVPGREGKAAREVAAGAEGARVGQPQRRRIGVAAVVGIAVGGERQRLGARRVRTA